MLELWAKLLIQSVKSRCHQREMENLGIREYLGVPCAAESHPSLLLWLSGQSEVQTSASTLDTLHGRYDALPLPTPEVTWARGFLLLLEMIIKLRSLDGEAGRLTTDGICVFAWTVYSGRVCYSSASL